MSTRFRVVSTTGYGIRPGGAGGVSNKRPPGVSYAVLDSAVGYRVVAEFNADDGLHGAAKAPLRLVRARERAAALEAECLAAERL